ncbi:MAG: IS4 family transposase [Bacteroidota bacterium]
MTSLKVHLSTWLSTEIEAISQARTKFCTSAESFSRAKILTFERCVVFLLNSPRRSLGVEMVEFFDGLKALDELCSVSAWVQARQQIRAVVFVYLNMRLCEAYEEWQQVYSAADPLDVFGFHRLLGVDGTTLYLPQTEALAQHFGVQPNGKKDIVMARAVACHDVRTNLCYHSHLGGINQGEEVPLPQWIQTSRAEDIWIYDRGFPSYWLFWVHMQQQGHFLARMPATFGCVKDFIASGKAEDHVHYHPPKGTADSFKKNDTELPDSLPAIPLRLIRVELSSGETEVLATSLFDRELYPAEAFAELYHQRWKVETFFDRLKNKLNLELFSGHLPIVIEQDFFASILLANILEICLQAAEQQLTQEPDQPQTLPQDAPEEHKQTQPPGYQYKINANIAVGILKNRLTMVILGQQDDTGLDLILQIMGQFRVPIRPHRSRPRTRRARKFKGRHQREQNYKRAV